MAARRLVIVMLVLLAISTLAAALVPTPRPRPTGSTGVSTETTGTVKAGSRATRAAGHRGRLVRATLRTRAGGQPAVRGRLGDELQLSVRAPIGDQVEIGGYGDVEPVSIDAPANFDLLLDTPGRFAIRLLDAGRRVGTLNVSGSPRHRPRNVCEGAREPRSQAPGARASARSCGRRGTR